MAGSYQIIPFICVSRWGCRGHTAIKAQFRARALRLYVNFLMMPSERIEERLLRPEPLASSGSDSKKEAEK